VKLVSFYGKYYKASGGNDALQKRYDVLQEIAYEQGLLSDENQRVLPTGLKGAFFRVVDFLSRPNYAIAGVFDVLQGTAKPGETVPSRILRELMGQGERETFGDILEQRKVGQGKLFDIGLPGTEAKIPVSMRGMAGLALDVFLDPLTYVAFIGPAARAMSRAGKVVGLTNKGVATLEAPTARRVVAKAMRHMDPDSRKAVAKLFREGDLDLERATALLETRSGNLKELAWVERMTQSEVLDLTTEGALKMSRLEAMRSFSQVADDSIVFNLTEEFAEARIRSARAFADALDGPKLGPEDVSRLRVSGVERATQQRLPKFEGFSKDGTPLWKPGSRAAFDPIKRAAESGLIEGRSLRFGDLGVFGSTFKGFELIKGATLAAPVKLTAARMASIIRGLGGEGFLQGGANVLHSLDKTFNSIPWLARQNPIYKDLRMTGWAMKQSGRALAIKEVREILGEYMGKTTKKGDKISGDEMREIWKRFAYASDNERTEQDLINWLTEASQKLGMKPQEANDLLRKHQTRMKALYAREAREGIQRNRPYEFYFPHVLNRGVTESEAIKLDKAFRRRGLGSFSGSSVSGFEKARRFPHIRDVEQAVKDAKIAGLEIVTDPTEALIRRFEAHFEGMADAFVERNAVYLFGKAMKPKLGRAISGLLRSPGLAKFLREGVSVQAADEEITELADLLARAAVSQSDDELLELSEIVRRTSTLSESPKARKEAIQKAIAEEYEARPAVQSYRARQAEERDLLERAAGIRGEARKKTREGQMFGTVADRLRAKKEVATLRREMPNLTRQTVEALERGVRAMFRERGLPAAILETGGERISAGELISRLLDPDAPLPLMGAGPLARVRSAKDVDQTVQALRSTIRELSEQLPEQQKAALSALDDIVRLKGAIREMEVARRIAAGESGALRRQAAGVAQEAKAVLKGRVEEFKEINFGKRLTRRQLLDEDVRRVEALRPELRDAFLVEMLRNARDPRHLLALTNKYGHIWDKMRTKQWNKLHAIKRQLSRDMAPTGRVGEEMVEHTFTKGPFKGETYTIPKGIKLDFANFEGKWMANPEVKGLLRGWDMMTNAFKTLVTMPFFAFHYRNAYSNVYLANLEIGLAALNPKRHYQAINILRGADGTMTWRGPDGKLRKETYAAIRRQLDGLDIRVEGFRLAEVTGREAEALGMPQKALTRLVRPFSKYLAGPIENEARAMLYIASRQRGLSHIDSAMKVKQYLFDYSFLSPAEKNIARRAIPFYTFQSKNLRLELQRLFETPGRVITPVKPFRERGPDNDMLPEYLRGELKMGITTDKGRAFITNIDLPIQDINILWRGDLGDTFLNNIGMLNPLFKMPFEIGFGMDSFTKRSLKGAQWMGKMGPMMDTWFPAPLKDFFELQKIPLKDGSVSYKANGVKVHAFLKGSFLSRILSTGSIVDDMIKNNEKIGVDVWKIMTGLQVRELDLTDGQKRKLQNEYRRLEEFLLERGVLAQFTKSFIPKEQRQKQQAGGGFYSRYTGGE
jgi:hypothetical protein